MQRHMTSLAYAYLIHGGCTQRYVSITFHQHSCYLLQRRRLSQLLLHGKVSSSVLAQFHRNSLIEQVEELLVIQLEQTN